MNEHMSEQSGARKQSEQSEQCLASKQVSSASEWANGRASGWGVLKYESYSDLDVTIVQPRDMDFRSRTTFTGSNFFAIRFTRVKNIPFNFLVFQRKTERKTYEIKRTVFAVCKTNDEEIWPSKSGSAQEIHVS